MGLNNENNDQLWYKGTGTGVSGSTVSLYGPAVGGFNQAFDTNNLLLGADNLFSTTGNAVGNNTNVDRLDLLFTGFQASSTSAFGVMERGPTTDHDTFKIAAITAIDAQGNPTGYGKLITESDGTWGKTNLVAASQEIILRKNNNLTPADTLHPSDSTAQPIGGVLIPTSDLVSAGTTIYGYSLFSADVTGSSTGSNNQLVNYNNTSFYHSADSTSTGGGLDPVAVAVLYNTSPVPEPASASLLLIAAGGILARRPNRRKQV
jgi:hypothetical protein